MISICCGTAHGELDHMTKRVECLWILTRLAGPPPRGVLALMSFHLALQHKPIPQSPAPSSLTSIDDDVDNTVTRVYFGPIQTPERALIAEATQKRNDLTSIPVRRSPRISALQNQNLQSQPSPLREEGQVVEATSGEQRGHKMAPPSTPSTPDEDEDTSQDGKDHCR